MINDDEQRSAAVPVAAVVTGEQAIRLVAESARLMAFRTYARHKMMLARNFRPTIKGFNAAYGTSCKTWEQVGDAAEALLKAARDGRKDI